MILLHEKCWIFDIRVVMHAQSKILSHSIPKNQNLLGDSYVVNKSGSIKQIFLVKVQTPNGDSYASPSDN